jgi:hypothetical protein
MPLAVWPAINLIIIHIQPHPTMGTRKATGMKLLLFVSLKILPLNALVALPAQTPI